MLNVQLAKDTFYTAFQARIAAGNPARTVVVRELLRPGVVVAENELPGAAVDGIAPADAFCLRWTGLTVDTHAALPLLTLTCEIRYATDGTTSFAGMDRGRALAQMDAELATAISSAPQSVSTQTAASTNVFWSDAAFQPAVMRNERMERVTEVEVFSYGQ